MSKNLWSKAKPGTLSYHKKKAWDAFSLYIRTRDCILTTGNPFYGICVTCPCRFSVRGDRGLQAGHFIAGRGNSLLFDERGCHGQCIVCNEGKGGAPKEYYIFMEHTYGLEIIEELQRKRHIPLKITRPQFDDIKEFFTNKTDEILSNPQLAKLLVPVNVDSELPF